MTTTAAGMRVAEGSRKDDDSASVKSLSKNTRQMKFMQRRNKEFALEVCWKRGVESWKNMFERGGLAKSP